MPKLRKKPVVIDGFRLGYDDMPDWFMDRVSTNQIILHGHYGDPIESCDIHTLEGVMRGDYGDYILKGVSNEVYPCKFKILQLTYDIIEE